MKMFRGDVLKKLIGPLGKGELWKVPSLRFASRRVSTLKEKIELAKAARSSMGLVPKPLDAEETDELVTLLAKPPLDEKDYLLDLLVNRVPPGVDEAAYVKGAFLTAIANGDAESPIVSPKYAVELLGTMQGGYNLSPLVELLDHPNFGEVAEGTKQYSTYVRIVLRCRGQG